MNHPDLTVNLQSYMYKALNMYSYNYKVPNINKL